MVQGRDFLDLLSHENYLVTTSNMVFTKELFGRVGGFANFRYVHDWDFALRAMAVGCPLYVRRYITGYRFHSRNTIRENTNAVNLEAKAVFDRYRKDFPEIVRRPAFQVGMKHNVYLTAAT
jgi:GT2 family glycosyltransferase